ncbi:Nif3-like dinuclear metal center hexameric protein [Deinococcus aquiradiocola]|uniref:Uncharacterized protein n=1 Tax=Deinococcus aquiradiocola TaxID=393059 RepID=A0A917PMT4_9DEIO|nr:Nif3-like dinuclear metal center hexameric protein [Deinococcus aquiradiocola]GGJ85136.1 hypothetical protein GCM10008939_31320 [Deinococcus aquiradiocola]
MTGPHGVTVTLGDLHAWLRGHLGPDADLHGDPLTPVTNLALALEPGDLPDPPGTDAVWLHRSRHVTPGWAHVPRLTSHDGFDAALTTGENWPLARALGWQDVRAVTLPRAAGLLATPPQATWPELVTALEAEFGGSEALVPPERPDVTRLALMNAMRPELLTAVAAEGARVYVTGQLRPGALAAARQLGLGVIAVGHRRSEAWGLRQLAGDLRATFPGLRTEIHP